MTEIVKIPKFVADYIENMPDYAKSSTYNTLIYFLNDLDSWKGIDKSSDPFSNWLIKIDLSGNSNLDKFIKAIVNQEYKVEAEPLYYVHLIPKDGFGYLNLDKSDRNYGLADNGEVKSFRTKFTQEEIMAINPLFWNKAFLEVVPDDE